MADVFTEPTLANYNDDAPSDDGAETAGNRVEWAKHIDEIGNPIKTMPMRPSPM